MDLADLKHAWKEATKATGEIVRDIDDSLEVGTEWPIEIQDEQRKPPRPIKVISEQH